MTDEKEYPQGFHEFHEIALVIAVFIATSIYAYVPSSPTTPKIIEVILSGLGGLFGGYAISLPVFIIYETLVEKITKQVERRIESKGGETNE